MSKNECDLEKGRQTQTWEESDRQKVRSREIEKEGDPGDEMYIIDKGTFNVFKKDESGKDKLKSDR